MHSEVQPAFSQLCNTHGTHMCLRSSNLSKEFFEGTRTTHITVHNKNTFLSLAHTHTQKKLNTVCTEVGNRKNVFLYEYKQNS